MQFKRKRNYLIENEKCKNEFYTIRHVIWHVFFFGDYHKKPGKLHQTLVKSVD